MSAPHRRLSSLPSILLVVAAGCSSPQRPGVSTGTPAPGTTPAPGQTSPAPTAQVISFLKVHNDARKAVGVPPLEWSDELAAFAQGWAVQLAAQGGNLVHRSGSPCGENLAGGRGSSPNPTRAAEYWPSEREGYRNEPFGNHDEAGHYTAMVWQTTTRVGYGMPTSPDGTRVVVANYSPVGNIVGQYPYRKDSAGGSA